MKLLVLALLMIHARYTSSFSPSPSVLNYVNYNIPRETKLSSQDSATTDISDQNPFTSEDLLLIDDIYSSSKKGADKELLANLMMQNLPKMSESFIFSLRETANYEGDPKFQTLSNALVEILDNRLSDGRRLLQSFLECGELRKLDSAIGHSCRDGKLDMAFFTVLNMNIADASKDTSLQPSVTSEDGLAVPDLPDRLAILQHIYTRCQEELEKAVKPGVALLNKLLRTEVVSIRDNQLRHYLSPQANEIKTPDGQIISLSGPSSQRKALVSTEEFLYALENAVKQIRMLEAAGGTDRTMGAGLVEECRQVAIEARKVVWDVYGENSDELKFFCEGLQPVFRPSS